MKIMKLKMKRCLVDSGAIGKVEDCKVTCTITNPSRSLTENHITSLAERTYRIGCYTPFEEGLRTRKSSRIFMYGYTFQRHIVYRTPATQDTIKRSSLHLLHGGVQNDPTIFLLKNIYLNRNTEKQNTCVYYIPGDYVLLITCLIQPPSLTFTSST
ncbi:uncharacterized protein LOC142324766 [Lycorma delicatula]|uniref:uncharacterized protein LOC142324766 n=1 Tax=Lycorma delicatula TaxID=130591 RepID=UPI003F510ED3